MLSEGVGHGMFPGTLKATKCLAEQGLLLMVFVKTAKQSPGMRARAGARNSLCTTVERRLNVLKLHTVSTGSNGLNP